MLILLLLPQGEKKCRILRFPHPQKPCLQSCHPVTDRLSGVAARRGRRFGWRKDVRRHPEGSAETGLPPATREKRRACRTDPAVFQPNRAPDVPVRHARRRASIARRLRGLSPVRAAQVAATSLSTIPAFAERSKSQAKTAERGAGRCHIKLLQTRQLPAPRPIQRLNHDVTTGVGGRVAGGRGISSPLEGEEAKSAS